MQRITVFNAERDFSNLVHRVQAEGVGFELVSGSAVIARLLPAVPQSPLQVQGLNSLLANLPKLADDAEAFSADLQMIRREFPTDKTAQPWQVGANPSARTT